MPLTNPSPSAIIGNDQIRATQFHATVIGKPPGGISLVHPMINYSLVCLFTAFNACFALV